MSSHYRKPIDSSRPLLDMAVECRYETMEEIIEILSSRYDFLSVTSIGETLLSRKIYMLTLGEPSASKGVLYVGAHHGMEWITTLILLRFVNEYCEYLKCARNVFGIDLKKMFENRELYIIPMLNADGVQLQIDGADSECPMFERLLRMSGGNFSKWQANARGVDLNHNYNAGFAEYKEIEKQLGITAGATKYSGEYPESEPESGALCNFLRFSDKIGMVLTLHTQGEEIYYTSGGAVPPGAGRIAAKLGALSGYTVSVPEGTAAYGGLTDWFIKEFNKPSFTIECGKGENPLPYTKYFSVYAGIREMLFTAPMLIP